MGTNQRAFLGIAALGTGGMARPALRRPMRQGHGTTPLPGTIRSTSLGNVIQTAYRQGHQDKEERSGAGQSRWPTSPLFTDKGEVVEMDMPSEFFAKPKSDCTKLFLSQILQH